MFKHEISRRLLLKYVTVAGIGGLIATRLPRSFVAPTHCATSLAVMRSSCVFATLNSVNIRLLIGPMLKA